MQPEPVVPGPGQESVWDYPRPPRLEASRRHIRIVFRGVTLAETRRAQRVLETSHPPSYYIPMDDVDMRFLSRAPGRSLCEWKGQAHNYDVVVADERAVKAAWGYARPSPAFASLRNHLAFYAGPMDSCTVDGEEVVPQSGHFYGGWITSDVVGPFKGDPGTMHW